MIKSQETNKNKSYFGVEGHCFTIFLFLLYTYSVSLYGLKFVSGAAISWFTGGIIWFLKILFQSGDDPDGVDKPFSWFLFLLFPLFIPLALPLWLIPVILTIIYLITVVAFGGHGKHIFNPVIVAVVFMLYGYSNQGLTEPSRPFPANKNGYIIWTSGIPPRNDIRDIYSAIPANLAFSASAHGSIPSIPGSCYSAIILIASILFSLIFNRRIVWLCVTLLSIIVFAYFLPQTKGFNIPITNLLFLGIIPSLLLCGIVDHKTIPESIRGQIISAIIFAFFAVLIVFNSSEILAPAYALLLSQVFSPLVIDIVGGENE